MMKITKEFDKILKSLYESSKIKVSYSLEDIMDSNESRLDYLNHLFDQISINELSNECRKVFEENIDFLYKFMNGEYNVELTIPKKYFDDKESCLIVPTEADLEYLFKLIESNKVLYESLYKNKNILIELPKETFNQNMTRILEIKEHNLAHLLGLTDSEPVLDPSKNLLKKYFIEHVENTEQYGDKMSERLLNWILSEEGKNELRKINKITIDFICEDKIKNPNNYDANGNIKEKSLTALKKRFKEINGFDFPIIKFSRYMTKCINSLNFLDLNNVFQIILDYNAPEGRKDEKDIFIVNSPPSLVSKEIRDYLRLDNKVIAIMTHFFDSDDEIKEKANEILEEMGIDTNDKNITSLINLIQTYDFVGKHGINPDQNVAFEKIRNGISNYFGRNIHLIGFDTEFDQEEINLDRPTTNKAHCDTSISLTAPELVDDYYKRGRPFFLDKIYEDENKSLIRISTPKEEMLYLEQMSAFAPIYSENLNTLKDKFELFNNNYNTYKNSFENPKRKK